MNNIPKDKMIMIAVGAAVAASVVLFVYYTSRKKKGPETPTKTPPKTKAQLEAEKKEAAKSKKSVAPSTPEKKDNKKETEKDDKAKLEEEKEKKKKEEKDKKEADKKEKEEKERKDKEEKEKKAKEQKQKEPKSPSEEKDGLTRSRSESDSDKKDSKDKELSGDYVGESETKKYKVTLKSDKTCKFLCKGISDGVVITEDQGTWSLEQNDKVVKLSLFDGGKGIVLTKTGVDSFEYDNCALVKKKGFKKTIQGLVSKSSKILQ